jgi:hypothetical protein
VCLRPGKCTVLQRLGVILLLFPRGLHYLPLNAGVIDQLVLNGSHHGFPEEEQRDF